MISQRNFFYVSIALLLFAVTFSCKKKGNTVEETLLQGSVSILVDESIFPIVEDQAIVFESQYRADITLIPMSEIEITNALIKDSSKIAVLTRKLSQEEEQTFTNKQITPRITRFASEGIAFISNNKDNDSLIELQQVINHLQGKPSNITKNIVIDNPNSSVYLNLCQLAGVEREHVKNISSAGSNEKLITFISENTGYIGIIGYNWITQPKKELETTVDNITVMAVKNLDSQNDSTYYKPTQTNLAKRSYPLTRDIYLLNYQGTTGLGMGFASFVAGDIGQRIVLKSGLAPIIVNPMEVNVKKN